MEFLNKLILLVNDFIWSYILIAMLIVLGLYFTFRTKFVQFGNIKEMFKLLGEGSSSKDKSKHEVSSFQAFCIGKYYIIINSFKSRCSYSTIIHNNKY